MSKYFPNRKKPKVEVKYTRLGIDNGFERAAIHYLNGLPHREDGPAVLTDSGSTGWALHGHILTFDEWCEQSPADDELKVMLKLTYG